MLEFLAVDINHAALTMLLAARCRLTLRFNARPFHAFDTGAPKAPSVHHAVLRMILAVKRLRDSLGIVGWLFGAAHRLLYKLTMPSVACWLQCAAPTLVWTSNFGCVIPPQIFQQRQ